VRQSLVREVRWFSLGNDLNASDAPEFLARDIGINRQPGRASGSLPSLNNMDWRSGARIGILTRFLACIDCRG